jgi:nitroreductase
MNRRSFLVSASAATIGAGGAVWFAHDGESLCTREDGPYSAWKEWDAPGASTAIGLIRSAVLASSPHNTQPWQFRVTGSSVDLYLDSRRSVAGLDPYFREAHIGMGCALENLLLAAASHGLTARVHAQDGSLETHQAGSLRLVAQVELAPGPRDVSELYSAIPRRHTNRGIYDPNAELPEDFPAEMLAQCNVEQDARLFVFTDPAQRARLTSIGAGANRELYSDGVVENGSNDWIRWRASEIRKFQDGLTIDNFGLPPVTAALANAAPTFLLKQAAKPSRRAEMYAQQMQSARLFGIIAVRDRLSMRQSLLAGSLWQRAHLLATARGVAARPCNEAIEMIDYERSHGRKARRLQELAEAIGDAAWQPTFFFMMGKPTLQANLSPRRRAGKVTLRPAWTASDLLQNRPGHDPLWV